VVKVYKKVRNNREYFAFSVVIYSSNGDKNHEFKLKTAISHAGQRSFLHCNSFIFNKLKHGAWHQ